MYKFNIFGFKDEIIACQRVIDSTGIKFDAEYINILVAAEDHRSAFHHGVDPVAVSRAVFVGFFSGFWQGASTVEQQFVRVATSRYEKKFTRKIKEQLLAVRLLKYRDKSQISNAYLGLAFYGSGVVGWEGLERRYKKSVSYFSKGDIIRSVACLKYPEPINKTELWENRLEARMMYIENRVNNKEFMKKNLIFNSRYAV
jgi:penicillin-binding protein 1A